MKTTSHKTKECLLEFKGKVVSGKLVRRYKRFFAEAILTEGKYKGELVTAHTPNTGSMHGLCEKGNEVLLSYDPSPKRKLDYTLQAIKVNGAFVSCNTYLPNQLVFLALQQGLIEEFHGYSLIKREVAYGRDGRSRIDIFLGDHARKNADAYIEIKNVTMKVGPYAMFPDAQTERGRRHLQNLMDVAKSGKRAVMVFLIARSDCMEFKAARHIDEEYADLLDQARRVGVEVYCLCAQVSKMGLNLSGRLPMG